MSATLATACLDCQREVAQRDVALLLVVVGSQDLARQVAGHLAADVDGATAGGYDGMGESVGGVQRVGVDSLKTHAGSSHCCRDWTLKR